MNNKTAIFQSRYRQQRVVNQINETQYTLEGPTHFLRMAGDEENITMVDFEGGPFVNCGDRMHLLEINDDRKIVRIQSMKVDSTDKDYAKVLLTVA
jgi:hypothetical protein